MCLNLESPASQCTEVSYILLWVTALCAALLAGLRVKHYTDFHHPLPSVENFSIIDRDSSQITWEAKEAIHIQRLDPNLNRNIGKMSIPHCFDPLIGAKPKHPQVGLLSQSPQPVDKVAPPSQIPGLNLTQFNEVGTFRPNSHQFLDRRSTRACRARALQNLVVCH